MKNLSIYLLLGTVLLIFKSGQSDGATIAHPTSSDAIHVAAEAHANGLILRLHEIHGMDKTKLTNFERKNLRKEVRTIKRDLKEMGGGVYVSVGALIIIILLLILIL